LGQNDATTGGKEVTDSQKASGTRLNLGGAAAQLFRAEAFNVVKSTLTEKDFGLALLDASGRQNVSRPRIRGETNG
jgi:hypothetical protein